MRSDKIKSTKLVYVEASDEKQAILDELSAQYEYTDGIVIVLPAQQTRAFQAPKDFHAIKLLKRQMGLPIIFVIPNEGLARRARQNGFSVYLSLEDLVHSSPNQQPYLDSHFPGEKSQPLTRPLENFSADVAVDERDDYEPLFTPTMTTPLADEYTPSQALPVTPLPPVNFSRTDELAALDEESDPFAEQDEQSDPFAAQPEQAAIPTPHQRLTSTPLIAPPSPPKQRIKRPWLMVVLAVVAICAAVSGSLLSIALPAQQARSGPVAAAAIVGHVTFLSSGQLEQMGSNGINDIVEISLSHLSALAQGKSYYAWLRSDANLSDGPVMLLGKLSISSQGSASLTYTDPQHNDLLASMSRILITEENASIQPTVPSPDLTTWRYEGIIPQMPNPHDQEHFSLLDHLRHLLASDPTLEKLGLHGGLNLWLYRNTGKLLEWTRNAQDGWGVSGGSPLMRRQVIRTLDYLDGVHNFARDVPASTPVLVDMQQGSLGLLQIYADENPPGYVQHVGLHLAGLLASPGATNVQRQIASQLQIALDDIQQCLEKAREDARQLINLDDKQLQGRAALEMLNDLVTQVTNAYVGTVDTTTGNQQYGAVWLFNTMRSLATISIQSDSQH